VDTVATPLKNDEITVRVGQEVTVRCLAKGHPSPRVYWRTRRRFLEGGATLHLKSVAKKDEGFYNCFAKLGETKKDKKQISLKVLSPES
jgi:Immunoglobulin domain